MVNSAVRCGGCGQQRKIALLTLLLIVVVRTTYCLELNLKYQEVNEEYDK